MGLGLGEAMSRRPSVLYHQGALGRAAHLFLLQAQILCQRGQLLLQHRGQHGPALALLM